MVNNRSMAEKLKSGLAVDLKDCDRVSSSEWPGEAYLISDQKVISRLEEDVETDFCDSKLESWIWSIGRRIDDGKVFASTDVCFYEHLDFFCMWLR